MDEKEKEEKQPIDLTPVLDAVKAMNTDIGGKIEAIDEKVKAFDARLEEIEKTPTNDPGPAAKSVNINLGKGDETREEKLVKAFDRYFRYGDRTAYSGIAAKAAMQEGTDNEGGYYVPTTYSNEIITPLKDASIMRMAGARVITAPGTDDFRVPGMTPTANVSTIIAEEGTYPEREPTATEIVFNPYKQGFISKASDELLADSRFPIFNQILAPNAVQDFAAGENALFTVGTGVGQPQGAVTGATVGVTAAAAAAITSDELISLYHSLNYLYRTNAVWMMNDSTIEVVRKLKDGNNQYLWQPGMQAGQPDRLLGRVVITNNSMAELATGEKTVLFGDMRYFWIGDFENGAVRLKRLNEKYAETGQVGFRWDKRYDSNVMLAEAIQVLQQA